MYSLGRKHHCIQHMPQYITVSLPHHSACYVARCNTEHTRLAPNCLINGGHEHREQGMKSHTALQKVTRGHTKDTIPKPVTPGIKQPVMPSLHSIMVATFKDSNCDARVGNTTTEALRAQTAQTWGNQWQTTKSKSRTWATQRWQPTK